jgi:hypothetical protein
MQKEAKDTGWGGKVPSTAGVPDAARTETCSLDFPIMFINHFPFNHSLNGWLSLTCNQRFLEKVGMVMYSYNPSYLGGGNRKLVSSRLA